ncbi:hypothetical protein [Acinetobacter pittii]|uniref:hypothetical protein n=1 Tax=Acinetobacter pittii TaxID=48296 RepID=UPI00246941ED|nr:hypothetical protein [Acinetobacter pittii]WGM25436.1 hypothetical protein OFU58_03810 [Acinetobacter pittii]
MIKASQVLSFTDTSPEALTKKINNQVREENIDPKVLATIANVSYTNFMWEGKLKFSALVVFHYQDAK